MDVQAALREVESLKQQLHNLRQKDLDRVARMAGFDLDRISGGHAIYTKEGFWANLSVPQHRRLKGWTARRLLNLIEASLYEEEQNGSDEGH